jgi:hypothetical protein
MVPKSLPSAHPGQTFFLPCPFSTGIDLFSFNSLIFSFPWSGAVSSDPWWEAFCIGLNQGEVEEEGKRKKKKKRKKQNIPPGKTQSTAYTTSFPPPYL